jgi:hypothetical protein
MSQHIDPTPKQTGMVKTKTLKMETVSFNAGTIGTRGQQFSYIDELVGKTLIGVVVHYISDSTKFVPVILRSDVNLYLNVYRATSSAVSNEKVEIAYSYIEN